MRTLHDNPESVVVAGDWHMNAHWACAAVDFAYARYHADTIVHVGDFGYTFSDTFVRYLTDALTENGQHLYFVDGNHDNHEYLAALPTADDGTRTVSERIHYLPRGLRWEWNGLTHMALGGAHSVDRQNRTPGVSWWSGERISLADAHRAASEGPVDVMFTHDCPAGVDIQGLLPADWFLAEDLKASDAHRKVLREVVDDVRPHKLYCGHYHTRQTAMLELEPVKNSKRAGVTQVEILHCDGTDFYDNMVKL